jgi:hypothetical protein
MQLGDSCEIVNPNNMCINMVIIHFLRGSRIHPNSDSPTKNKYALFQKYPVPPEHFLDMYIYLNVNITNNMNINRMLNHFCRNVKFRLKYSSLIFLGCLTTPPEVLSSV